MYRAGHNPSPERHMFPAEAEQGDTRPSVPAQTVNKSSLWSAFPLFVLSLGILLFKKAPMLRAIWYP